MAADESWRPCNLYIHSFCAGIGIGMSYSDISYSNRFVMYFSCIATKLIVNLIAICS